MQRDNRAYLNDIVEACEAMTAISRLSPALFARITNARRIVDFRNQLAHQYSDVDDTVVWLIARHDAPVLHAECTAFLKDLGD